jgi:hypothetical protein
MWSSLRYVLSVMHGYFAGRDGQAVATHLARCVAPGIPEISSYSVEAASRLWRPPPHTKGRRA